VAPRLEEEMPGLTRGHGDQPADQRGGHRIEEHQEIADHKADGADEVQALVDPAVMIIAMIVPALDAQLLTEVLDHALPQNNRSIRFTGIRCKRCDIIEMSYHRIR